MIAQAPVVPTTSDLATLDPAVAITLLVVVGLAIVGFYTKDFVKARIAPAKPADQPTGTGTGTGALPAALPAVIDRSAAVTDEFIATLKEERDYLRRQVAEQDREIQRLNDLIQRATQWPRGTP